MLAIFAIPWTCLLGPGKLPASGPSIGGPVTGVWPGSSGLSREAPGLFWKRSSRVGRFFEAHLLPSNQSLHDGPRRLGPPYEDSESSEVFRKPSILALATQGTGGDDE